MDHNSLIPDELVFVSTKDEGSMIFHNDVKGGRSAALQQTESADTFPYFKLFPSEVQATIWFNTFTPRRVDLREGVKDPADDTGFIDRPCPKARSSLPAAAFVSRESRRVTLSHYYCLRQSILKESQWFSPAIEVIQRLLSAFHLVKQPRTLSGNGNVIYVNPKIDHLFVTMEALRSASMPQYLLNVLQYGQEPSDYTDGFRYDEESSSIINKIKFIDIYCTGTTGLNNHGARVLSILKNLKAINVVFGKEPGEPDEREETIVTFDMTKQDHSLSDMGHMKITEVVNGSRCIPYYKEKNAKEQVKFANRRRYGLVSLLGLVGLVGLYMYYNRQYLKQVVNSFIL